jgi:predicted AAA+ superfamily ATPase
VVAEIVKQQANAGRRREIYCFRDEKGLEVDFLVPGRTGSVPLVECKASRTVTPAMAAPLQRLAQALRRRRRAATAVRSFLVHEPPQAPARTGAVASGVGRCRGAR